MNERNRATIVMLANTFANIVAIATGVALFEQKLNGLFFAVLAIAGALAIMRFLR